MIKGVLFDVDGTLVDTVDAHAKTWQITLARHGHPLTFEQVRHQIGKGGDQLMPVFLSREEIVRSGEQIERERLDLYKREYQPKVRAFPETRELFRRILASGRKIVLATSSKQDELRHSRKLARIDDLIDDETCSEDAERSKPHPDIFEAALAKLGPMSRSEVLVVGDTPYDAEAAGKASLRTIGFLCGGFPEEELRRAGCIAIYRDPADLLAHFDESPLGEGASKGG